MATSKIDNEAAAAAGVAVPVSSYDDYTATKDDQVKTDGRFAQRAIDSTDIDTGWTAQTGKARPAPEDVPGQVFAPWQLPDPNVAVRAGLPVVPVPEHLVTEDEDHPQGPTPQEVASRDAREAIRARAVSEYKDNQKALDDAKAAESTDTVKKTPISSSKAASS